ncbi:hypothetical protein RV420_410188 [Roseovarius sp. EC-SD190]|nr:hypothetical protein RV420_410188 [Roseovarius sp. EC-SD190]
MRADDVNGRIPALLTFVTDGTLRIPPEFPMLNSSANAITHPVRNRAHRPDPTRFRFLRLDPQVVAS